MKKYKDKNWLYKKYWGAKLPSIKIAKLCKTSHTTILNWLKKFNIRRRTISETRIGKHHSKGTKQKMSEAKKGEKGYNWGKHLSEKTKQKLSEARKGEKHYNWKGGRKIDSGGYVLIWKPEHFNAYKNGYIFEHHLVYEEYWREKVPKGYLLHHMDRDRANNDITNIPLLTFNFHGKIHGGEKIICKED